jgi:transcriptional antiterminator Rof (Rho-off)
VANKLRLAMLHEREVQLNLQDGRSISAHIDGMLRNLVACAQLNTGGENVIVPLEHIAEVAGVDDLCCDDFLRAA